MPLCPQITNTPITVTLTADFTVTNVIPVLPANTEQLDGVIVLVDGKTKAYYQTTAPITGMTEGDIWFDTDDGYKLYYYTGSAWTSVQDTSIAAAQSAATAAQTTADGKNKIYRQGTTPTGTFAVGDTWFNTSADNAISRWDGSSWVATTLGNNALANISASKITAGTIDASVITVSNLDAGNITTGYLGAARIATGSLDATKITAGTITATQISSSYIYAGTIAAGNITAGTVTASVAFNAASGTFSGTITASAGTIGGWSINSSQIYNGGGAYLNATNGNALFAELTATGSILAYNGISTNSGADIYSGGSITANSNVVSNASATFGNGTSNPFYYLSSSGTLRSLYTYGKAVTGRAMQINSSGDFGTTASTLRKKHDVMPYSMDTSKLLQLKPKTFKYLPEIDEKQEQQYGFIAEEAEALGLEPLVLYNEEGQVDYFAYEKLPIFLLQLAQEQDARIKALEGA